MPQNRSRTGCVLGKGQQVMKILIMDDSPDAIAVARARLAPPPGELQWRGNVKSIEA
jgi:hypothetical protein